MDIDIDFADRKHALQFFKHRLACIKNDKVHNSGVYFQDIPHNPITNVATIDYVEADQRGYFKLDFLNLTMYKDIKSEEHLITLMNTEPRWDMLEYEEFVEQLNQINGYSDLVKTMKPTSVMQLAAVIAMIRPGKKHLIGQSWDTIMKEIWTTSTSDDGFTYKKAHAVSYAVAIVVQMNLLCFG